MHPGQGPVLDLGRLFHGVAWQEHLRYADVTRLRPSAQDPLVGDDYEICKGGLDRRQPEGVKGTDPKAICKGKREVTSKDGLGRPFRPKENYELNMNPAPSPT
ncbi:hypothetical protein CIB48_g3331 [Xylaria polymorpha]|nr:hypothetical protein CIB48_g3331 [Xylaria polymorpha]